MTYLRQGYRLAGCRQDKTGRGLCRGVDCVIAKFAQKTAQVVLRDVAAVSAVARTYPFPGVPSAEAGEAGFSHKAISAAENVRITTMSAFGST
jgi:hypothetical protein